MAGRGWKQLLTDRAWYAGQDHYPIPAYSEFMPAPRVGRKPGGRVDPELFADDDPYGWQVTEYEEAFELQPGLDLLARELVGVLRHLGRREPAHGIAQKKLQGNPYWPAELHEHGAPDHERYMVLMPLALSRTQDDKGRVRWTLFGGSEQGPSRAFWRGFYSAPKQELPEESALDFFRRLISAAYDESPENLANLHHAGLRILPTEDDERFLHWSEAPLPSWTKPYLWSPGRSLRGVKYLLTFRPFARLPKPVRNAYLAGDLHLLPFPGSMVFWGTQAYYNLHEDLPLAMQIPLLHSIERHEAPHGLRVPQSGWLHEPGKANGQPEAGFGPVRNTFTRTHRWQRVHRQDDVLQVAPQADHAAHVLFSSAPDDLGLYGKPMARNAQIWTRDFRLLLDGPNADRHELAHAAQQLAGGGLFGYRFVYPAMRVDLHEVYWQRPLVAYLSPQTGEPQLLPDAPLGYFTGYRCDKPQLDKAVELWPRLLKRPGHCEAIRDFRHDRDQHFHETTNNIRKLLEAHHLLGQALEPSFARQMLKLSKQETLDQWLDSLPSHAANEETGQHLIENLRAMLTTADNQPAKGRKAAGKSSHAAKTASLTYHRTAKRSFEKTYWNTISKLAAGEYINKVNSDCVLDPETQKQLSHSHRDLEALGDYILAYYDRTIEAAGMTGKVLAGELPFHWHTDFDFPWQGGWVHNQDGETYERDLVVVIPGRDRTRAVIMGDHYDTAYMEDHYGYSHGGGGPRLAAAGADDNHSATATLMLGAPVFMELSKAGKLACDVWLIHLTGEEFPSDCMGARHLCQRLIQRDLKIRLTNGRERDLSKAKAQGVYVLDMVAHNNDRNRDVFQICPGTSRESMWLAYQAHVANRLWNESTTAWNARADRRGCGRGKRSADAVTLPDIALHPVLSGEVRPTCDPRSTLYNTDGQIFSDAGVPVVLFMENYDINRKGYHDSFDTMANIDLDYGSAVAAIAIESVARAASEKPPWKLSE